MPGMALVLTVSALIAAAPGRAVGDPVAGYPMDEGKGAVLADRVSGQDCEVTNGVWVRNRSRAALRFDGETTFAEAQGGLQLPLTEAFSVDMWYLVRVGPEPMALVVMPPTFRMLVYPRSRRILVDIRGEAGRVYEAFEAPVEPGAWQHLAVVYGPEQGAKVYLDGEEAFADSSAVGQLAGPGGAMGIGLGISRDQQRYFRGAMAGLRIWDHPLSVKEIGRIMKEEGSDLGTTFRGPDDIAPKLPPAEPIDASSRKQLFIDERFIEASKGLELTMNPPVKLGPVLVPEKPWELNFGFCASVIDDDEELMLFYRCQSPEEASNVCLATSEDGIHWTRPELGVHDYQGSADNNIVFEGVGEAVVFLDPHGATDQRFKMIAQHHWPDPERGGLYCHTSPDGIHWRRGPRVLDIAPDTANQAAWDHQRGKYVAYIRKWDPLRKVGRIETDDIMEPWPYEDLGEDAYFIWGEDKIAVPSKEIPTAFGYDDRDPRVSDHYNPAAVEYPWAQSAYFMFPSAYMHFPEPPVGEYANDGLLDIQMAVSRDGVEFRRVERGPYVSLGRDGDTDSKCMYMAVGMLRMGDDIYQYYGGYDVSHGRMRLTREKKQREGSICAVRQRLDGFVSADAAYGGGELLTPPIEFQGKRLVLNIDTSAMGACHVGILDAEGEPIDGFSVDECDEIHGNYIAKTVTWNGEEDVSELAGGPVRLHFRMRAAKLYAFQFPGE